MNVTPTATEVIERVRQLNSIPDGWGIRLFPAGTGEDEMTVAIDFAEERAQGDEVSEQHGTMVFVAQEVVGLLASVELDAVRHGSADGDRPLQLVLRTGAPKEPGR